MAARVRAAGPRLVHEEVHRLWASLGSLSLTACPEHSPVAAPLEHRALHADVRHSTQSVPTQFRRRCT